MPYTAKSQKASETSLINLNDNNVVPDIVFPGLAQSDFQDAFNVLQECLVTEVPVSGFNHPFISPGGHYNNWWQLDASISLQAAKWANQEFAKNMLRNFIDVQKPDGRIPLYGLDEVPDWPECSSLPKLFEGAYAVLRHSGDKELAEDVYRTLETYLLWWLSPTRRDKETGLITGVFEESFPPLEKELKAVAQVDLNVEIVAGLHYVAKIAKLLGRKDDYKKYNSYKEEISSAINEYMWNEKRGAFFSYHVKDKKLNDQLISYTFDPLKFNIATPDKIDEMLSMLIDDEHFNWKSNPITSASKKSDIYNETVGNYDGAPAWSGSIWSLRNETVIQGLEDIGRYDLSSYLALNTIRLFNANYTEFLKPSDGSGQGVKRYAWSATHYLQLLIEKVFGVRVNMFAETITIMPNLDESLMGEKISLEELLLPNGNRLKLSIAKKVDGITIKYKITGESKDLNVTLALPLNNGKILEVIDENDNKIKFQQIKHKSANIYQVFNGHSPTDKITFVTDGGK